MKKEIIPIEFKEGQYKAYDESLKQWNHSQKLAISGLDISDEIVEVHFSLQEYGGGAKRMVGTVIDGVIHVDIPVFILEGPEWSSEYYNAYAWIYLSDEESAETVRKIEFTIEARPKPEEYATPDELSFLQQLEQAIKNKITTPTSAKVGQLLSVKAVDENGKPTEFDVVDQSKGAEVTVDNALSEESTNPVQNQVVTKEVITLKEHNTKLKETIEKLQIKVTTEKASFHNIKDSANMKVLDFGMEGKTTQDGTPTPENQVEIVNAGVYNEATGRYEIGCRVGNVNLLDYKEVVNNFRNKNYVKLASGYNVTSLQFEPNTEYYMKVNGIRCTWATFLISTQQNVNGSVGKAVGVSNTWDSEKCVTTDETGLIYFSISNPIDNHIDQIEQSLREALVQIEIGSSATPYIPHASQQFTLTSPVPLTKWDYLTKRDGVYGWSIWSIIHTITEDEYATKHTNFPAKFEFNIGVGHPQSMNEDMYCNIAKSSSWGDGVGTFGMNNNYFYINFQEEEMTKEECLAKIKETPIELCYKTPEEQAFHPLPDEEQTLLNNLETYYGVTNLYNDQGCPTWLTYIADPKLYLDNQLLEIKSAIV